MYLANHYFSSHDLGVFFKENQQTIHIYTPPPQNHNTTKKINNLSFAAIVSKSLRKHTQIHGWTGFADGF